MIYILFSAAAVLMLLIFISAAATTTANLGNITGAVLSLALLFFCLLHKSIYKFIGRLWERTWGKASIIVFSAVAAVCIILAAVISVLMIRQAQNYPENGADAVIVLGCRVKPDGASLMLRRRAEAACSYLMENPSAVCIASGGKGSDEPFSEAEAIRDVLIDKGISPDRIIMEDRSTTTAENFAFSCRIMKERGLGGRVVIATSEFHQYRAMLIAEKNGLADCAAVSSHTQRLLLPSYWIREWYAVIYEWVKG